MKNKSFSFSKLEKFLVLLLGLFVLSLTLILDPPFGFSQEAWHVVGVAFLMATWWMFEVVPIAVTALLPLILFPILGLRSLSQTAAEYGNPIVFLFLGGFLLAQAMQNWGLHQRIALRIVSQVGTRPTRLILGFMLATAFLSMWVSNTATAMMMYPIGLSAIKLFQNFKNELHSTNSDSFAAVVMLGIAYAANIGGIATLIGTPPNALTAAFMEENFGVTLRFGRWMLLGAPLMIILLAGAYFILIRFVFRIGNESIPEIHQSITQEFRSLGGMSYEQKIVATVFVSVVLLWILVPLFSNSWFASITDTGIVIAGAVILFLWPSRQSEKFLLNQEDLKLLPWGVLILFGGGLCLASVIESSKLAMELENLTPYFKSFPVWVMMFILVVITIALSEVASNTATVAALLPLVVSLAVGLKLNPLFFTIPLAFSASCAFMMPVGTPPNALIYGSGLVTARQMARVGVWINLLSAILITVFMMTLGRWLFKL